MFLARLMVIIHYFCLLDSFNGSFMSTWSQLLGLVLAVLNTKLLKITKTIEKEFRCLGLLRWFSCKIPCFFCQPSEMMFLEINRDWRLSSVFPGTVAMSQTEPVASSWCPGQTPSQGVIQVSVPGFSLQYPWIFLSNILGKKESVA